MLVLSRKIGECIRIGERVVVKVVSVRGGQVRLGIEAPAAVSVLRSELRPAPESSRDTVRCPLPAGSLT